MVPGKIEKLCLKARQAIAARDWEKAKQAYLMALGLKSDSPDIHYGLATVFFQLQELTSAAHHFREVTRLDPLRAGAHINLGAVLNLLQQHDEAVTALRRGIQLDPARVEGYYNLGLVYRHKGQGDLAIHAYRETIRLNPRMADAHLNLANLYLDKNQTRMALQHYEQALAIRPGWDKALDGQAHAQAVLEQQAAGTKPQPPPAPTRGPVHSLDRMADPYDHAVLLSALHDASGGAEKAGKELQQVLSAELEPAIKELSTCLLYANGPRSELDTCIAKFEAALGHMRKLRQGVQGGLDHLQKSVNEHFPNQ
jgi:tetratricopeptide (TPR) repeat protein